MSQAALQLVGAELAQPNEEINHELSRLTPADTPEAPDADADMARVAELEAAFVLFGAREDAAPVVDLPATPAETAVQHERYMPKLEQRGLHLDGRLPVQLLQAIDWIVISAAAEFSAHWGAGLGLAQMNLATASAYFICALALKAGLWITDSYHVKPSAMHIERSLGGLTLGAFLALMAATALAPDARASGALSAILPGAAIVLAGIHSAIAVWARAAHKRGVFSETIVVIGATEAATRFVKRAARTGEARIIAIAEDRLSRAPHVVGETPVACDLDALLAWDGLPQVDRIVIAVTQKAETRVHDMIARLKTVPNRVDLLLDYESRSVRGRGVDKLGGLPVACVSGRPRNLRRAAMKRVEDILLSGVLVVLLAPALALIAGLIKLETRGPVLYRQRRYGFNNRPITVLKFRTMRHDPSAEMVTSKDDARLTRIGRFLRASGLDGLPQLLNVLRGDMSLVGPRPHRIGMRVAKRDTSDIIAEYAHRHSVKPGITGWAQIKDARGALKTPAALRKHVRLDLEYVARASLWFDLQILVQTVTTRGAEKGAH